MRQIILRLAPRLGAFRRDGPILQICFVADYDELKFKLINFKIINKKD